MSNQVKLALFLLVFGSTAVVFGQDPAGATQQGDAVDYIVRQIDWTQNGILAAVFTVILGAFKAVDVIIARRTTMMGARSDGADARSVELKLKLEQIIDEIRSLASHPSGIFGKVTQELLRDLEDVQRELDQHATSSSKTRLVIDSIDDKLTRIHEAIEQLSEIHTKTDNDGTPLVYIPRSWHETQRDILNMLTTLASNQRDLIEIVRNLQK